MNRVGICMVACGIAIALSCLNGQAQETARVPDANPHTSGAVDASVHADVEEGTTLQPQQPSKKRPVTYSKWGFPPANQPVATRFRPPQPKSTGSAGSLDAKDPSILGGLSNRADDVTTPPAAKNASSNKPDRLSNPFDSSLTDRPRDRSAGRQLFETQVQPPLPVQPPSSGFSTPFHAKQLGGFASSSVPDTFPKSTYSSAKELEKSKKQKPLSKKSGQGPHGDAIADSSSDQKKKIGPQLTVKPR